MEKLGIRTRVNAHQTTHVTPARSTASLACGPIQPPVNVNAKTTTNIVVTTRCGILKRVNAHVKTLKIADQISNGTPRHVNVSVNPLNVVLQVSTGMIRHADVSVPTNSVTPHKLGTPTSVNACPSAPLPPHRATQTSGGAPVIVNVSAQGVNLQVAVLTGNRGVRRRVSADEIT